MPRQPAASCVEALVWLIVRTVKGQPIGPLSGSTTLSDHDVERFMAGDRGGARPTVRRASTMAAGMMGAAMAKEWCCRPGRTTGRCWRRSTTSRRAER